MLLLVFPWLLIDKCPYSQSHVFSSSHVQMLQLDHKEGWAPRIDTFELWCYRRLLRVPWIERRSNQSILKEINPEYSWEGLMLKLKRQHFGHLIQRSDSLEKTLIMSRKIEGRRRRRNRGWDGWMASLTQWIEFEQTQGDSEGQGSLVCCVQFMRSKRVQHD